MKTVLTIDGAYFARRVLGQINMNGNVNNLLTDSECEEFSIALTVSFCNLYQTFNNERGSLISNVVFVTDNDSWRKYVEPFKPYYIKEGTLLKYKENRVELKEKSDTNFDNFYKTYNEWYASIGEYIPTFNINKAEGDDLIMLVSKKLTEENVYNLIFCTDGDLKQTVSEKTMLFRNIRSKDAPNGEFVLSPITYDLIFNKPVKQTLLNTGDTQYWHKLFGITIGCIDGSVRQTREFKKGIEIAEPAKVSLIKIIGGDSKDNVFSIFSWDASTGTRTYSVTELQIKKAIDMCGWEFNNTGCRTVFDDYSNLQVFVNLLRKVIKQENINLKDNHILDHIKHNMKMIILSPKFLPENLVNKFEFEWDKKKSDILVDVDYSSFVKEKLTEFSNTKQTTQIYSEAISNIGMEFFKK